MGTVVIHVLVSVSNDVVAHVAVAEKVIRAFGTGRLYAWSASNWMEELVKLMVVPELGIPLAVKFALNQMYVPPSIGVPLKFEVLVDCSGHLGGGGEAGQLILSVVLLSAEKIIAIVFSPTSVAEPDAVKVPDRGPNGWVTDALNVPLAGAVKGPMEPVMCSAEPDVGVRVSW